MLLITLQSMHTIDVQAAFTKRSRSELGLEELERQLAAAAIVDTDRRIIDVAH